MIMLQFFFANNIVWLFAGLSTTAHVAIKPQVWREFMNIISLVSYKCIQYIKKNQHFIICKKIWFKMFLLSGRTGSLSCFFIKLSGCLTGTLACPMVLWSTLCLVYSSLALSLNFDTCLKENKNNDKCFKGHLNQLNCWFRFYNWNWTFMIISWSYISNF